MHEGGNMIRPAILFLAAVVALPLSAQTPAAQAPAKTYAQYLVDTTASRHPARDSAWHD